MLGGNPCSVSKPSQCRVSWPEEQAEAHHSWGPAAELTRAEIPEGGPRAQEARVLEMVDSPLRGWCPHRCMTAWIATAAASSPSPRTPVWKRDSERNAGTPGNCGWSTFW